MRAWCVVLMSTVMMIPPTAGAETVATVAGEAISDRDIVRYVDRFPQLRAYLATPGGPNQVLDYMISDRLLTLEGERLGVEKLNDGDPTGYVMRLEQRLIGTCPMPTETEAKAFFDQHSEQFASPLRLRLQRIALTATEESFDQVVQRLNQIKTDILSGDTTFAEVADEISQDPIGQGRGGDIGFSPLNRDNPLFDLFDSATPEQIIGPVQEQDRLYLYRVTGRQEPIPEQFANVVEEAKQAQRQTCQQQKRQRVLNQLKQRWPVEILDPNISIRPEQRDE